MNATTNNPKVLKAGVHTTTMSMSSSEDTSLNSRYRDQLHPQKHWSHQTGYPPHHHNNNNNMNVQVEFPKVASIVKGPKEAYHAMADKGVAMANDSLLKIFHQSVYAGVYIGFGGMLSMVVAGGLEAAGERNPAIQTFVFAALFPVNLLIILLTGGVLFTGTTAAIGAAFCERRVSWKQIPRTFVISWLGNFIGAICFAFVIDFCELNEGLTADLAVEVAEKKVAKNFIITFTKGIGCNWLVCMAVFLCGQAQDMAGKMVGIWFPISCFVAIGFEHIPANMFMIPLGMLAGADVSVVDLIVKNFIPVTLGNAVAGSFFVGAGYSYAFGHLGELCDSKLKTIVGHLEDEESGHGGGGKHSGRSTSPTPASVEPSELSEGSDEDPATPADDPTMQINV